MDVVSNLVSSVFSLLGGSSTGSQTSDYYKLQGSQYAGIDYSTKIEANNKTIKNIVIGFLVSVLVLTFLLVRKSSKSN